MRRPGIAVTSILLLGGCGFQVGGSATGTPTDDAAPIDVIPEDAGQVLGDGAPADAPDYGCYGTGLVRVCLQEPPLPELRFSTETILDTGATGVCMNASGTNHGDACVIAGANVKIEATIRITGSRPLVIVGTDDIVISAAIHAGSYRDGTTGPGANNVSCASGSGASNGSGVSGGGAGGSFTGAGGKGGSGVGANAGPVTDVPAALRAGCPGSKGADPLDAGGRGGRGGGALALIATNRIQLTGAIVATGQSGQGGGISLVAGGGGGGSGGMIVLDAMNVQLAGEVNANGGGGGEGSDNLIPGRDGRESGNAAQSALGGSGSGGGGDGGLGSSGNSRTGTEGSNKSANIAGGGGGGGGAGYIKIYGSVQNSATVSPPAS